MSAPRTPPDVARDDTEDEDPNSELRPFASPPCYAHEVDPTYFGLDPEPETKPAAALKAGLQDVEAAIGAIVEALEGA